MSTLKIEERIAVSADPERVWAFLLDPARVAACLPGARLDGAEGDRTFLGTMKVKVGPARMELTGQVLVAEGGGSEIVVVADVDLAGKLVRFGRGMMEGISKQIFKQF